MARHKTISDEQLLDRLFDALIELGPDRLSFARAAKACGLSASTLVQRYGDREAMVQATLMRAWDRLVALTEAADSAEPLTQAGAINLLMRLTTPETAERDATAGLLLLREDILNPTLRARGAAWGHQLAEALGRRLSDDPQEGRRLGWQLASLWQGAHLWWAFTREEPADQAIRRALEAWSSHR